MNPPIYSQVVADHGTEPLAERAVAADYNDDRPGMMRVHVAHERARLACQKHTRATLNAHASRWGVATSHSLKSTLAWYMAQHGLIDADGNLRDRSPGVTA